MKNLPIFKLEDYLSKCEFNSPYLFGCSDVQSINMSELLSMAKDNELKLWNNLSLGYTESPGMPLLREEISSQYSSDITKDNILCFAGAEEGIYALLKTLLTPQDHCIVVTPCYQSLESIPRSICSVSPVNISHKNNWQLDLNTIKDAINEKTKLILINFPHNPTGAVITKETQQALVELARSKNIWIFSDEVYRFLELNPKDRLPPIASIYEKGISLSVMSKAYGLAGLRIGWLASQNTQLLHKTCQMKHYLSICNSAPSEILALIALKNREKILQQNLEIMTSNIALLDDFMKEFKELLAWVRPKGGCIGFPKLLSDQYNAHDFCEQLREQKGVVALPNTVYDVKENHFRVGFGRKNMPEALLKVKEFIKENF